MTFLLTQSIILISIFALYSCAFFMIYKSNKKLKSSLWWGITMIVGAANILLDIATAVNKNHILMGLLATSYVMTAIMVLASSETISRKRLNLKVTFIICSFLVILFTSISYISKMMFELNNEAIVNFLMLLAYLVAVVAMTKHQWKISIKNRSALSLMTLILYLPYSIIISLALVNQGSRLWLDTSLIPLNVLYSFMIIVMVGLGIAWSLTIVYEAVEILKEKSEKDPLTGISNRRHFFEEATRIVNESLSNDEELYFILLDIDNFKSINDSYGHSVGDEVLKQLVKIVNEQKDGNALFARLGGEEFCLLIRSKGKGNIENYSENLRESIAEAQIELDGEDFLTVTVSMGVASLKCDFDSIDNLVNIADQAMYEAKRSGKNRCVYATC